MTRSLGSTDRPGPLPDPLQSTAHLEPTPASPAAELRDRGTRPHGPPPRRVVLTTRVRSPFLTCCRNTEHHSAVRGGAGRGGRGGAGRGGLVVLGWTFLHHSAAVLVRHFFVSALKRMSRGAEPLTRTEVRVFLSVCIQEQLRSSAGTTKS